VERRLFQTVAAPRKATAQSFSQCQGGAFGFALGLQGTSNGDVLGQAGALFDGGDVQNSIQVQTATRSISAVNSECLKTRHSDPDDLVNNMIMIARATPCCGSLSPACS
jgi:hypothetical protein